MRFPCILLDFFSSEGSRRYDEVLGCVQPKVTDTMNILLHAPYSADDIYAALQAYSRCIQIPDKAPGLEGLNLRFFQHYWDVVR